MARRLAVRDAPGNTSARIHPPPPAPIKDKATQKDAQDAAQVLATAWVEQFAAAAYSAKIRERNGQLANQITPAEREKFAKDHPEPSFGDMQKVVLKYVKVHIDGKEMSITLPADDPTTRPTTQPTSQP